MRVEHEAHRRKAVELEVKQLRDQISELLNRITRKPIYNSNYKSSNCATRN